MHRRARMHSLKRTRSEMSCQASGAGDGWRQKRDFFRGSWRMSLAAARITPDS